MIFIISIFFLAIIIAFGMLVFRAWEIKTGRITLGEEPRYKLELSFRYIEKIILYITKHVIQWIVLSSVKLWFLVITKTRLLIQNKLPKISKFFQKKQNNDPRKISFVQRAVIESKIKIKKVKEKIKKDHEEIVQDIKEEVDKII